MMLNVPKIVYKNELYRDRLRQVYITNALVIEEFDGVKLAWDLNRLVYLAGKT